MTAPYDKHQVIPNPRIRKIINDIDTKLAECDIENGSISQLLLHFGIIHESDCILCPRCFKKLGECNCGAGPR